MTGTIDPPLTDLLQRSAAGDGAARDQVWHQVHDRLRRLAQARLAKESAAQCQPTELVHEAYLKLADLELAPRDREHFYAIAARARAWSTSTWRGRETGPSAAAVNPKSR